MTVAAAAADVLRAPPHDLDAERALLGAVLLDEHAVGNVVTLVAAEDFYRPAHAAIFAAATVLHGRGEPTDAVALARELERTGAEVGGRAFLAELVEGVSTSANADHYARLVRERAVARRLLYAADDAKASVLDGGAADEVLADLEARLLTLRRDGSDRTTVSGADVATDLARVWEGDEAPPPAIPTGLADLDAVTGGLHGGRLVVVAGATSMGKTTFALTLARHAIKAGRSVLVFSLEMGRDEVVAAILGAEARVRTTKMHNPKRLTPEDRDRLYAAQADGLDLSRLRVFDAADVAPAEVRSVARREVARGRADLVVLDYVQLVGAPRDGRRRDTTREQEVASVSRALKLLARETGVPVVALAQLNREADKRTDHRPILSDLRESAALAHDADLVLAVYRESYYHRDKPSLRGRLDALVLKNRHGAVTTVELAYDHETGWIGNAAQPWQRATP